VVAVATNRAPSLATTLSTLIVEAMVQIGLTQEDVLSKPTEDAALPWQIPPLVVEATLFDVPLSEYLDRVVYINAQALLNLWSDALLNMKNNPDSVISVDGGFRATSYAIPNVRSNERQLHLSMPEGFPGAVTDTAVSMLCLECAHLLRTNARIDHFVNDDSNYYAVLYDTKEVVGIKDGLPALFADQWDISVEGSDYNIVSKVRLLIHKYAKSFRDFEALDWALQTLRVVDGHVELLSAVRAIKKVAYSRAARLKLLEHCVEVLFRLSMTDRQRIESLKGMLVPEIMSSGKFSKMIYPFYAVPPALLSEKVLVRIRLAVQALYEEERRLYAVTNRIVS
jgi:hypothetical protein